MKLLHSPLVLAGKLRAAFSSPSLLPVLSAGIVSGLSLLLVQVAFGTFIFSGALSPYSSQGIGLILFGNFAACLLFSLLGGYRGVIAGLSPAVVLVMATVVASVDADGEALLVTAVCTLIFSAVATGVFCLLVGNFQLANLLRFIPYPVVVGFVAGIGGAACLAALSLMGVNLGLQPSHLLEPIVLWTWLPGLIYGIALYGAIKYLKNSLILPVSALFLVGAYFLALFALDISYDEAREAGLLLTSTAQGNLWPAIWPTDLVQIDWSAIVGQILDMIMLILIALIAIVMNIAGLEVAVGKDLDWNREFRVTGIASIFAGLGGGTVATIIVPISLRHKLLRASTRMTGIIVACVIGSALLFGDGMLQFVPTLFVGGVLVFAGLGMLDQGLIESYKRLPRTEFAIVLLIFVAITFFGLLEGVISGMVATLLFFTVRLSRLNPIESVFTTREHRSKKARTVPDRAILLAESARVKVYKIQGYIFFGSVNILSRHLKDSLSSSARLFCLMIDCTNITGFDFSAVNVVARLVKQAAAMGVHVVFSGLSENLRVGLERNLPSSVFGELYLESNIDLGMERCEDLILAAWKTDKTTMGQRRDSLFENTVEHLESYLDRQIHFENLIEALRSWLIPRRYAITETISAPGVPHEGVHLLLSGLVSVYNSDGLRLRQYRPGDAIWPIDPVAETAMIIVADEPCRTMLLKPETQRWLEQHEQELTIKLYQYLLTDRYRN